MEPETYYNRFSEEYDKKRLHGYFGFINSMEAELLSQITQGKKTLEIGCGTGLILQKIRGKTENLVGIDLSFGMLKRANAKGLFVTKADATALPFQNDFFDVVFSFKTLPHVPDIEKALREANRITKKNGFVVLEFYNPYSIKRLTNFFIGKKVFIRFDSFHKIKKILPKNFSIENVKGIRIIAPSAIFFSLPVISKITKAIERFLSKTPLTFWGSYLVVVCKKK